MILRRHRLQQHKAEQNDRAKRQFQVCKCVVANTERTRRFALMVIGCLVFSIGLIGINLMPFMVDSNFHRAIARADDQAQQAVFSGPRIGHKPGGNQAVGKEGNKGEP